MSFCCLIKSKVKSNHFLTTLCGSNTCHNCTKKHFLLWLFSREHICVKENWQRSQVIVGRRDIMHIWQSNLSTSEQIFVFPNICLCWWQTSSSDGRKHLIECKEKIATKYLFSQCYFFFAFFASYVSSKLVAFFTWYVSSELPRGV